MFLSVYRFRGEPAALRAGHQKMLALIPPGHLQVHVAVPHPEGLDVYDTCPSLQVAEAFTGSMEFGHLLAQAGLPVPAVERLGDVSAAVAQGHRLA